MTVMKWMFLAGVFCTLFGVVVFVLNPKPVALSTVSLTTKDLSATVNIRGRLESQYPYTVFAKSEGQIRNISVRIGDWVNEGDTLFVLDRALFEQRLQEAVGQLRLKELSYTHSLELVNAKRVLLQSRVISHFEYTEAEQQAAMASAQLDVARAQFEASKLALENTYYVSHGASSGGCDGG